MNVAIEMLTRIQARGIRLEVDGPDLVAEGPLTDELINELRQHKPELLEALRRRELTEAIREHLDERAAIQEFDGELPREQAEQEAKKALRVFEYQIADSPSWLFMLAPNYTLEQAERSLRLRFGDRLVAVRRYEP